MIREVHLASYGPLLHGRRWMQFDSHVITPDCDWSRARC